MNDQTNTTIAPLVYNGEIIHERDEMLSLTDMWKAAKSPANQEPFNWSRKEGASFIDAVRLAHNLPDSQVMTKKQGRSGGTWAHWQIALAYAKYLSHEFHMWCNTVVRERMEGKLVSIAHLPADILELIRRTDGIARSSIHKITETEKAIADVQEAQSTMMTMLVTLAKIIQPAQPILVRHGKTAGQILRANHFRGIKGLSVWFGNRLERVGCRIEHNGCAEMGLTKARLFDPDKAQQWLDELGGMAIVNQKCTERRGQGKLRLVPEKEDRPRA